jgi:hypothetical protein
VDPPPEHLPEESMFYILFTSSALVLHTLKQEVNAQKMLAK